MVEAIHASPGSEFTVTKYSTLGMINQLQNSLTVTENGKDAGVLSLTYTVKIANRSATFLTASPVTIRSKILSANRRKRRKASLSSRNSYRKYVAALMLPKTN